MMADEAKEEKGRHFKMSLSKQSEDFNWEIENFELWPLDVLKTFPKFSIERDLTFYATLQTKKHKMGPTVYCHFTFHLERGEDTRVNLIVVATDSAGKVLHNFQPKSHLYQGGSEGCELDPCSVDKLLKNSGDPVLIFKCTMEYIRFNENVTHKRRPSFTSVNQSNLTNDLRQMYIEAQNTDTTLKVADVYIPVHKCILSKRSPVFAKMLEENKIEYEFQDLQPSVLQGLVEFLYSANLYDDSFEYVHDLYHAADHFDVDDLKMTCISVLRSKLDVRNACQALVLANDHQDIDFKASVMDFILFHYNEIVKTTVWKQFIKEQTSLASEVMEIHIRNAEPKY